MQQYWETIERLFRQRGVADVAQQFGPPAIDPVLTSFEQLVRVQLPEDFKAFYRVHEGQGKSEYGLIFGLELLSLGRIKKEWTVWKRLSMEGSALPATGFQSDPEGHIRKQYLNLKWIPFISDGNGNHVGIDMDPDLDGRAGQVITFGRDTLRKRVLAPSFAGYLEYYTSQLRNIDWRLEDGRWLLRNKELSRLHYCYWPRTRQAQTPPLSEAPSLMNRAIGRMLKIGAFGKG